MSRLRNSILFLLVIVSQLSYAQMVVTNPTDEVMQKLQFKTQLTEQSISSAMRTITRVMSGDISGTLDLLSEQTKSLKKISQTFKTGQAIVQYEQNVIRVAKRYRNIAKQIDFLTDHKVESPTLRDRLRKVKGYLQAFERTVANSRTLFKVVMDTDNMMNEAERLKYLLDADKELTNSLEKLDKLQDELETTQYNINRVPKTLTFYLPPEKEASENREEFKKHLVEQIEAQKGKGSTLRLYKRYSAFIDSFLVLFIAITASVILIKGKVHTTLERSKIILGVIIALALIKQFVSYLI